MRLSHDTAYGDYNCENVHDGLGGSGEPSHAEPQISHLARKTPYKLYSAVWIGADQGSAAKS